MLQFEHFRTPQNDRPGSRLYEVLNYIDKKSTSRTRATCTGLSRIQ